MKAQFSRPLLGMLLAVVFSAAQAQYTTASTSAAEFAATAKETTNWREDNAYTLGQRAYLFGMPYAYFQQLRYQYPWVKATPELNQRKNQFWHQRRFTSAEEKEGGTPNTNLFYSVTSFDVSKEPLILSVPEIKDRYYTHEFISMDSDNFAYVGTRATGTKAGHYAIVGPNWKGKLPKGVTALPPSRTPFGMIYGRTWINGPDDIATAHKIQDQYKLTPLSVWGKPGAKVTDAPELADPWAPYPAMVDGKADPLAEWKTINRALAENPPNARHAAMLGEYRRIGVGPGFDVEKMDDATKRGLIRAAKDARLLVRKAFVQGMGTRIGSWIYPPSIVGRAGLADHYILRAVTALIGNGINDPEENVYLVNNQDSQLQQLISTHRYTLRFAPDQMPKVDALGYWSLTMYGLDNNLVSNPINRYTFASKPAGNFVKDADGGATFYVQTDSPGAGKEANWLPAPAGGKPFYLILRAYLPSQEILNETYVPPQMLRVE